MKQLFLQKNRFDKVQKNLFKKALSTECATKCFALLFGVGLWAFLSQNQIYDVTYEVPVCFSGGAYDVVPFQESVLVTLRATRRALAKLDAACLAIHMSTDGLQIGRQYIVLGKKDLFLPSDINMVHCNPRIVEINVGARSLEKQ